MPTGPAARVGDATAHGGALVPGPGSTNVFIGGMPAWRGVSAAVAAGIVSSAATALGAIMEAQAADTAAAGTPAAPAAKANLMKTIAEQIAKLSTQMLTTGADNIACPIVKVVIPDGSGVVINGSQTVLIGGFPACRVGDMIQEVTSVNSIAVGCSTVIIGG
jgi:uncharacterized Zn-binding protein involved in type VI secretion